MAMRMGYAQDIACGCSYAACGLVGAVSLLTKRVVGSLHTAAGRVSSFGISGTNA